MVYIISFLEGIITFISPCLLPMLPIYVTYFAGQDSENKKYRTFVNASGFVLGFSTVFIIMGAFAASIGGLLNRYATAVNIVSGIIIILFGLHFIGILKIDILNKSKSLNYRAANSGFLPSVLFGAVFSIGWTPCVGAFLGSALMLAASSGNSFQGVLMLASFSLGLGISFILSAVIIQKLKAAFEFIKRNNKIISIISGILLIIVGILMITGIMGKYFMLMTF